MTFVLDRFDLDAFVAATLAEDLGEKGDITSAAVIPAEARFTGVMDSREPIVVAGLPVAEAFFRALDPEVTIERLAREGAGGRAGTDLLRLSGKARALLTAERSALNIVQHLSGIATLTRRYVDAIAGHRRDPARHAQDHPRPARPREICDPHGRRAEPPHGPVGRGDDQGQSCRRRRLGRRGGAPRRGGRDRADHRRGRPARADRAGAAAGATHLLLDNMDVPMLREAVALVAGRVPTEASGGVTLETIRAKAETGVTYVSVGRITQSAPAADIGLDFAAA